MLSFTLPVGPGAGATPRVTSVTSAGRHGSDPAGRADGSLAPWILGGAFLASQMRCENWGFPKSLDGKKHLEVQFEDVLEDFF